MGIITEEKVIQITKGRVGYYWETEDSYPVIEVFINGTEEEVINIKNELNSMDSNVIFDHESFTETYHRILFSFYMSELTEEKFTKIVEELEKHGDSEYTL